MIPIPLEFSIVITSYSIHYTKLYDGDIDLAVNFGRGGNASGTFAGLYIYENIGNKTDGLLNEGIKLSDKEGDVFVGDANNDRLMDIYCEGDLFINQSTGNKISFTKTKNTEQPDWPTSGEYDWNNDGLKDRFTKSQWHLELVDGNSGDTTRLMVGESEWSYNFV